MALEWIQLDEQGLSTTGCYCLRSMPKTAGYRNQAEWAAGQLKEGLQYVLVKEGARSVGFIEYMPGEQAWRVLHAEGYLVIQCLWAGLTGQGLGSALIDRCIQDARVQGKHGVAVITNADTSWAPGPEIFSRNGFVAVDAAPYGFELYTYQLDNAPAPYFPRDWDARLARYDDGLTILRSDQCPYIEVATANVLEAAAALNIKAEVIHMDSREKMMELSPTPYGVFNVIYNGELISYHRLTPRSFAQKLRSVKG
ncbi:GNAT family N-acetyltransferase [Paenibacillus sp. FSL L8-0463]|uniref:GNAT family N-acetyltransferase n=1 Tax=Paenibacillus sp. FSL L8-0463 TaxID=2954687 RepID=UPI0031194FA1